VVKAEVFPGEKITKIYFETRDTSTEGLAEIDELFSAILGSRPKTGGYTDSNKFLIEVLNIDLPES
jgi:hypothetical protein